MADNPAPPLRALVVDDERNIRGTLAVCLEGLGAQVAQAPSAEVAFDTASRAPFDLAFVDLRLGQESGLDLIPRLLAVHPALDIVVITAFATIDTAVEAIRRGARDYLPKPFTPAQIRHIVDRFREQHAVVLRLHDLEARLAEAAPEADLRTRSPAMQRAIELLSRAAASDAPVLLRGESGTGKGVFARALHAASARRAGPFVTVNCPTLTEDLLASELFGHVKGSFTGAVRDQAGKVEMAEGGTLFLDEIAEVSPGLQAKLLRFLQDKEFERLGENRTRRADVRVVTATNRDLEADVAAGRFRRDLLYRLNVLEIALPPLRDRPEDILPLARNFLGFFARTSRKGAIDLSPDAEQALVRYAWPGNVRELRNAIERAIILWPAPVLEPAAFPFATEPNLGAPRAGDTITVDALERSHIERVLDRAETLEEAARILGLDASTLYRKRKKYGI